MSALFRIPDESNCWRKSSGTSSGSCASNTFGSLVVVDGCCVVVVVVGFGVVDDEYELNKTSSFDTSATKRDIKLFYGDW